MKPARLHWSLYFFVIVATVAAAGAVFGAVAFTLFGLMTGADFPLARLALKGAKTLGFYFMLWAPGIAIVLCVKRAYEQRRKTAGN